MSVVEIKREYMGLSEETYRTIKEILDEEYEGYVDLAVRLESNPHLSHVEKLIAVENAGQRASGIMEAARAIGVTLDADQEGF